MRLLRLHPPLMVTALGMLVLALVSTVGLLIDDRVLTGAPIWVKPLKFSISLAIYTVTLAWLISLLTRGKRVAHHLGTVIGVSAFIEMAVIVGQAARGRLSHFNYSTPLDTALWSVMGVTIVVLWLATLWIAVLLLIQRIAGRAEALAIRFGIVIALAGLATGFLMTQPTAQQMAAMRQGEQLSVMGAHSVGLPDGGPGLPLVNWSTEGGDLRVGHFVGMHALQALPLLALLLTYAARRWPRLRDEALRIRLIVVAGVTHAALTALVVWQALRGQPLTGPDTLTIGVAVAIALVAIAGLAWSVTRRSSPQLPGGRGMEAALIQQLPGSRGDRAEHQIRPVPR